ncbi:hypothetical protein PSN45_002885 [Yamadazyma tenuis]|uniref:uncharacterized protein n=1 Tax=Candida tenuis TaxID=2315449 RepID=UPI00279CFA34|nr:hypothetical protein PSN45_002885 [Yamadazyma tenuis]
MISSKNVILAIAVSASQFLVGVNAEESKAALLKRALIEAGFGNSVNADILGFSGSAYKGASGEILGDHLAAATASAGVAGGLPLGLAEGSVDGDAGASILKRGTASSTGTKEAEVFKRYLTEAGYDIDSRDLVDQVVEIVKKNDHESSMMKRQIISAFGPEVGGKMVAGVAKREIPQTASNNRVGIVKRALIEAGFGADAEAEVLGATAGAYVGADGEILGDHLAAATASAGVGAGIPGIISGGASGDAGASILKRALIEAGFGNSVNADILGFSGSAYKGASGEILGDHLAAATASAGVAGGLPLGLAEGSVDGDAGASILKRALIEAGFGNSVNADILGFSGSAYKGASGEILGDHLAAATASAGVAGGLPLGLAEGSVDGDAGASILKRALIEAGFGNEVSADILGFSGSAYKGASGEILGDHLAAATASAGVAGGLPLGLAEGSVDGDAGASIL